MLTRIPLPSDLPIGEGEPAGLVCLSLDILIISPAVCRTGGWQKSFAQCDRWWDRYTHDQHAQETDFLKSAATKGLKSDSSSRPFFAFFTRVASSLTVFTEGQA